MRTRDLSSCLLTLSISSRARAQEPPSPPAEVTVSQDHVGPSDILAHYPHQLSGGMQQRVALARVLVNHPRVLLMDEPLGALDAQNRHMQQTLLTLWQELRMTVVFVTHDVDEAAFLSDRIVVLTQRPARVRAELQVSLDRPRTPQLLASAEYARIRRQALEPLLDERHPSLAPAATQSG